jgi:KipI family sensor histidine kinase inhibitor
MPLKWAPAGDRALLIDLGAVSAAELHATAAVLRARQGVLACIVGQQSLYLVSDRPIDLAAWKVLPLPGPTIWTPPRRHVVAVSFAEEQAPDLPELLRRAGIDRATFLGRVGTLRLTSRYLGFRAGFAYLDGWPPEWSLPRRPTSRPVPRGSFAIAGGVAGFYPIDTPGGWSLLGRTAAALWDPHRHPPNLIAAGDELTLVPLTEPIDVPPLPPDPRPAIDAIELLSNGQLTTVVTPADWRRVEQGLAPGGPFDPEAAALANRQVGNPEEMPLLECALLGPRLRFRRRCAIAWSGADCDLPFTPLIVEQGGELALGRIRNGLRGWLAVRPLADGEALHDRPPMPAPRRDTAVIRVLPGPHETPLRDIECEVTTRLDRVGIRLRPLRPVGFAPPADLPSSGMQFGTIQLHPDGSLVAMGPDHPLTGGYLQPLTVLHDDRSKLAQLTPGQRVLFATG